MATPNPNQDDWYGYDPQTDSSADPQAAAQPVNQGGGQYQQADQGMQSLQIGSNPAYSGAYNTSQQGYSYQQPPQIIQHFYPPMPVGPPTTHLPTSHQAPYQQQSRYPPPGSNRPPYQQNQSYNTQPVGPSSNYSQTTRPQTYQEPGQRDFQPSRGGRGGRGGQGGQGGQGGRGRANNPPPRYNQPGPKPPKQTPQQSQPTSTHTFMPPKTKPTDEDIEKMHGIKIRPDWDPSKPYIWPIAIHPYETQPETTGQHNYDDGDDDADDKDDDAGQNVTLGQSSPPCGDSSTRQKASYQPPPQSQRTALPRPQLPAMPPLSPNREPTQSPRHSPCRPQSPAMPSLVLSQELPQSPRHSPSRPQPHAMPQQPGSRSPSPSARTPSSFQTSQYLDEDDNC